MLSIYIHRPSPPRSIEVLQYIAFTKYGQLERTIILLMRIVEGIRIRKEKVMILFLFYTILLSHIFDSSSASIIRIYKTSATAHLHLDLRLYLHSCFFRTSSTTSATTPSSPQILPFYLCPIPAPKRARPRPRPGNTYYPIHLSFPRFIHPSITSLHPSSPFFKRNTLTTQRNTPRRQRKNSQYKRKPKKEA